MALLKKCYNIDANSLLESVIALTIISICLYIASMVYAAVFTIKTTTKFYTLGNRADEIFFLAQIGQDSLLKDVKNEYWEMNRNHYGKAEELIVTYKDSLQIYPSRKYYIIQ